MQATLHMWEHTPPLYGHEHALEKFYHIFWKSSF